MNNRKITQGGKREGSRRSLIELRKYFALSKRTPREAISSVADGLKNIIVSFVSDKS